eukprot:PhF_6_TR18626/c0_g1_i1/m.27228
MVDRLSAGAGGPATPSVNLRSESAYSNPDPGSQAKGGDSLESFYSKVTEIQNGMKDVKSLTQKVQVLYSSYFTNADKDETKRVSEELEVCTDQVHSLSQKIKDILKVMDEDVKKTKEENDSSRVAELRIMENQHAFLLKQFIETMKIYHNVQSDNEKKYKQQVVRRLQTKCRNEDGSTISEAKAQEMAEQIMANGSSDALFQQSKHKLEEIIETRNEVVKIEKAIRELHQLFVDLGSLIQQQGEVLDDIALNMRTTNKYMEKGIKELKTAKKYTKKNRKKMIWIIMCILIIIAAITAGVVSFSMLKK